MRHTIQFFSLSTILLRMSLLTNSVASVNKLMNQHHTIYKCLVVRNRYSNHCGGKKLVPNRFKTVMKQKMKGIWSIKLFRLKSYVGEPTFQRYHVTPSLQRPLQANIKMKAFHTGNFLKIWSQLFNISMAIHTIVALQKCSFYSLLEHAVHFMNIRKTCNLYSSCWYVLTP